MGAFGVNIFLFGKYRQNRLYAHKNRGKHDLPRFGLGRQGSTRPDRVPWPGVVPAPW